jgi:hypothetical protein
MPRSVPKKSIVRKFGQAYIFIPSGDLRQSRLERPRLIYDGAFVLNLYRDEFSEIDAMPVGTPLHTSQLATITKNPDGSLVLRYDYYRHRGTTLSAEEVKPLRRYVNRFCDDSDFKLILENDPVPQVPSVPVKPEVCYDDDDWVDTDYV